MVRHRLPDGGLTDSVGELLSASAGLLLVRTRRGDVTVDQSAVQLSRVVPPRPIRPAAPHRALSVSDLQLVMASHWPAADREWLGPWLLRATDAFTDRANSVLAIGSVTHRANEIGAVSHRAIPGGPGSGPEAVGGALEGVRAWYAARGLPAQAAVARLASPPSLEDPIGTGYARPDGDPEGLEAVAAALEEAGWVIRPGAGALVLTAPTAVAARPVVVPEGLTLELSADPDAAWLEVYHYNGVPVPPIGEQLLRAVPDRVFASLRDGGGTALAVARGTLAQGWAAASAVATRPEHRRRGLGRTLMAAVGTWAAQHRAAAVVLQTAITNPAAQRMYLDLGFEVHHRYDYWQPR